ncbi:MAG: hypothetical protein KAQ63_00245 [Candidatus Moranbacteria bacterium]|nr:hypothetical protein [Candidatus Moranbacteria bacterium]
MSDKLFNKIKKKWQTVMILVFMVVAITFSISIFIPARYSSKIKMIIIQNHQSDEVDAFSAAKSAEYLSDIIANVVFTESFIQDMLDAPFEVKRNFSGFSEEKMKTWEKTVDVDKENNTGILTITTFDRSKSEAEAIAESIAWGLNVRGSKYHGGGDSIKIKTIDGPITSEKSATPNVLLNSLLALIVGIAGAVSVVNFFDDFELVLFRKNAFKRKNRVKSEKESTEKITASLEKIRKNLKNQMVIDDYSIDTEKLEKKSDEMKEIEEVLGDDEPIQPKEIVKEIQSEVIESSSKRATAPKNLPIFREEKETESGNTAPEIQEKTDKGFISMEELNQEAEKMGLAGSDDKEGNNSKYEASSEEVKKRLNKLLKGEL